MTLHGDIGDLRHAAAERCGDAAPAQPEERSQRVSRWAVVIYVLVALATPLLLYAGPDVLSPTAPAIAEAALDGHLSMHAYLAPANAGAADHVH